ncbi:hypothetical protein B9479_005579 [Cryptococcus floricola]|uniref:Uncharacterized protein n=1 Tax=Cryptococcus floricola TaxID=2591691 RepID=A0A5D3ASX9_9TREE|nr:hypothetical protein B9479_005579 [Cryptococcus floricola]
MAPAPSSFQSSRGRYIDNYSSYRSSMAAFDALVAKSEELAETSSEEEEYNRRVSKEIDEARETRRRKWLLCQKQRDEPHDAGNTVLQTGTEKQDVHQSHKYQTEDALRTLYESDSEQEVDALCRTIPPSSPPFELGSDDAAALHKSQPASVISSWNRLSDESSDSEGSEESVEQPHAAWMDAFHRRQRRQRALLHEQEQEMERKREEERLERRRERHRENGWATDETTPPNSPIDWGEP